MKKEEIKDGIHLVQMLFDALLEALDKAEDAIEHGALEDKNQAVGRAIRILFGLQTSLELGKSYELSEKLNDLYGYCISKCTHANTNNDVKALEEVRALITEVASAWAHLPMIKEVA